MCVTIIAWSSLISHGNRFSHLGVTALYLQKTTWNISCLDQTSTLLGALASNIHRCLSYMCRLSWIIIMALTFCGKKSEVGASVCYGHISSLYFDCFYIHVHIPLSFNKSSYMYVVNVRIVNVIVALFYLCTYCFYTRYPFTVLLQCIWSQLCYQPKCCIFEYSSLKLNSQLFVVCVWLCINTFLIKQNLPSKSTVSTLSVLWY